MRTDYAILKLRSRSLSSAARAFIEHFRNVEAQIKELDDGEHTGVRH